MNCASPISKSLAPDRAANRTSVHPVGYVGSNELQKREEGRGEDRGDERPIDQKKRVMQLRDQSNLTIEDQINGKRMGCNVTRRKKRKRKEKKERERCS